MSFLSQIKGAAANRVRWFEDWWYETTRRVHTGGDRVLKLASDTLAPLRDGKLYLPARVRNVRQVLKTLPIDPATYTLVDLGSGKGRVVFIATEFPFQKAMGVEYSFALHEQAQANLRSFRSRNGGAARIEFLHADAAAFPMPAGNLVLFFFNPFGPEVMGEVLNNLCAALHREPRHVIVVLLWPELSGMVAALDGARQLAKTRRYDVFELGMRP